MWPEDFWPDDYWDADFWPKEGSEPPVGGGGGEVLGLAPKRTFADSLILGGGGSLGG